MPRRLHDFLLWSLLIGVGAAVAGYAVWSHWSHTLEPPVSMSGFGGVADFEFVDQTGHAVTKDTFQGKVWIVGFVFTRCSLSCPKISEAMAELQRTLPGDILLAAVSVDPKHDTVDVLRTYAGHSMIGADPKRWLFLTEKDGSKQLVYDWIERSFKTRPTESPDPDEDPGLAIAHSNRLMLIDRNGRVVDGYLCVKPGVESYSFEVDHEQLDRLRKDAERLAAKTAP